MKTRIYNLWVKLRASYWFVPTIMLLSALGLSFAMISLDETISSDFISDLGWLYTNKPEGAREVLSAISGSMITVAGVVFSITIVALSLASSQFGPRLLGNFMRDRGNQIVLGTFIATYFYCLLVLRTIRSGDETSFVPHLAVNTGVLLAICSLGVLIYFIHHVAESIQVSKVILKVSEDLHLLIRNLYPEEPADAKKAAISNQNWKNTFVIHVFAKAKDSGYLQAVDKETLLNLATEHNLVIDIVISPGEFCVLDQKLCTVYSQMVCADKVVEKITDSFIFGSERSIEQDVIFPVNQLVEISLRALSPSINDPFTAVSCLDRLTSALCLLAGRENPVVKETDENGQLRVISPSVLFPEILAASFNQIRHFAKENSQLMLHFLHCLFLVSQRVRQPENKQALLHQAKLAFEEGLENIVNQEIREKYIAEYNQILSELNT